MDIIHVVSKNCERFQLFLRTTQTTGDTEAESVCMDLSDMSKKLYDTW